MNINIDIYKKTINEMVIEEGKDINIDRVLMYKDNVYISLEYLGSHPNDNRNVLKFDKNGKFVWRVQAMDFPEPDRDRPFTYIGIEDGKLYAYNPIGYNCYIDMETGEVYVPPGQRPW